MRTQFFMDARDYRKYSLLDDAMRSSMLEQLTLIWMLTPDVPNGHGRRKPRYISTRTDLNHFFARGAEVSLADVPRFFRTRGYTCHSYGDSPPNYLTSGNRNQYFDDIHDAHLTRAVVFVDPDNGIEPISGPTTAHVRLDELHRLWSRMTDSVLLVYQHKPRVSADVFWPTVARRLVDALSAPIGWLPCGDMGFLFAGPEQTLETISGNAQELGHIRFLT